MRLADYQGDGLMGRLCIFALASAALLLALSGCVLYDQNGAKMSAGEFVSGQDLTVPKYLNENELICRELPGNKPCYCMACSNKTSYGPLGLGHLLDSFYDNTLVGGNCSISACNESDYQRIVHSDNSTQMRTFMLGAGQSFVSSGKASLYCNYTLQLATKWMKGGDGAPPNVPLAGRAACLLQRSMLPLYIYYTEGKAIDPARTRDIANAFEAADAGPVFVTTEAGLNSSNDNDVASVKQQVRELARCDKCLTVLAVKPNDYDALYKVLGVPPDGIDQAMYGKIDAVGFGFRANDYPYCNPDRIIDENRNFSLYILRNYSLPTIWLYAGASEGNSSAGGCNWTNETVSGFYSDIVRSSDSLASSGVLGVSLYEFVDGSGPLPCNGVQGCTFGMLAADGSQKHPMLNSWAAACQEVNVNSDYRTPLIFSRNSYGGACEAQRNSQASLHAGQQINSNQAFSYDKVLATAKKANLGCGEVCPANTPMPSVYDSAGTGFGNKDHCTLYPMVDEYADDFDVSATYFRAIIEQESGFEPMAVSPCVNESSNSCNKENYTMAQICELAGNPAGCKASFACPTGEKPCAYGLAQCIEYPGKAYTDANPYGKVVVQDPNGIPSAIAKCGGEKYNPFDPGQSACCGAGKFAGFLRDGDGLTAEKWVNNNWAALAPANCQGGMADGEQNWAAYYIASNMYYGARWNMLSQFVDQRPCTGGSGTYNHYIDYLRNAVASPNPPGTSYGAQVMSRYKAAARKDMCDSDCLK